MTGSQTVGVPEVTMPEHLEEASGIAAVMDRFSETELMDILNISPKIASEVKCRYGAIVSDEAEHIPAILAYTGAVFKRINPSDFTAGDFRFAQGHLRITSFLYGLLRPLDLVAQYRLEGNVRLPGAETDIFGYWRPVLTNEFIREIKEAGGLLVDLASEEMKNLFDWEAVCREVRVVRPEFISIRNGKPRTVVIYAKMCRGEMTRMIIKQQIEDPGALKSFRWDGFMYNADMSSDDRLVFSHID